MLTVHSFWKVPFSILLFLHWRRKGLKYIFFPFEQPELTWHHGRQSIQDNLLFWSLSDMAKYSRCVIKPDHLSNMVMICFVLLAGGTSDLPRGTNNRPTAKTFAPAHVFARLSQLEPLSHGCLFLALQYNNSTTGISREHSLPTWRTETYQRKKIFSRPSFLLPQVCVAQ